MKKIMLLVVLMGCRASQATYNGFDMTQDRPITGLPLTPDRLYTPSGNYTKLLKQRHAYCRLCKRLRRQRKFCRRHQQEMSENAQG